MGKYKKRDPESTRRLLIDSIEPVLFEKGYSQLSAREICNQAGVDPGLVNYYFGSFHNLLKTYIHENDFWMPALHTYKAAAGNEKDCVSAMLKQQFYYFLDRKEMRKFIHWQLSEFHPAISSMASIRENEGRKLLEKFKSHFEDSDIDLEAIVAILLAGTYALVLQCDTRNSTVFGIDTTERRGQERVSGMIDLILKLAWEAAGKDR